VAALVGLVLAAGSCGDSSLIGPELRSGSNRIWEVSAVQFPSAFDVVTTRRLFLGTSDVNAAQGDIFLDGPASSTELRLRSIASLLRAEPVHAVGLQDLGMVDFDALEEVPEHGYSESEDSTGVAVGTGHVYALRINRGTNLGDNFAKLVVDSIGETGSDPDSQFIDFRFVAQTQPGNNRFNED
jgi:hypothetical protein